MEENNEILDELSIENEENTFQKDKIIGSITFNCDFKNNLLDTTNNSSITQNLVLIEMSNYTPKEVYYKKITPIFHKWAF